MQEVLKIIGLFLFSSVKFLFAPGATVAAGYNFFETLAITISGGFFGVFVFFYAGRLIIRWFMAFFPPKKNKKKFSRRNKMIIRSKNRFGLMGLAALLGVISIPLACFLVARYHGHNPRAVPYLLISVCVWALGLTFFSVFVKTSLF